MGIGYQGRTLKEMLEEKDRLFGESGHIYGLDRLELVEEDPAKLMRFQMRLLAACINAKETGKLISASPTALAMGELLFMLATSEGDVVCASHGLMGQIQCVPFILRSIVELGFEDEPGIREGDIFSTNDPYYGAPHASDCFTFVPIFYKGELIAWAVGMNHIMEVGGIVPGNLSALSPNAFTDGWLYPPMKTGENFKQHKWWELLWMRRTRMGDFNILDDKMRVTGAVMLHNRALEIVEEFGIDYFRKGIKEILERERRYYLERIRTQAVPGTYQLVVFFPVRYKGWVGKLFPSSDRDWLLHMPNETRILSDGRFAHDLEGLTSEGDFHCQMWEPGIRAMASLGCWPTFAYTPTCNSALAYMIDYKIPPGTMGNMKNPFASTAMGTGIMSKPTTVGYFQALSYAYLARGFLEECFPANPCVVGYGLDGVMADGFYWAGGNFSFIGGDSYGGRPYKDGEPSCMSTPNPEPDMGEVEQLEFLEPTQLTIGKKLVPNYCGHGKFRGGRGTNMCELVCDPGQHLTIAVFSSGSSETCTIACGFCGGYPGLGSVTYFLHDTNMRELIEKGLPYPTDFVQVREWLKEGKLKAKRVEFYPSDTPNVECRDGDLFITAAHANSGWGDPLERELSLVERDVYYGWLTPDVVRSIYGAVTDEKGKIKLKETEELRQEMRNRRKERSVDARDWWRGEREQVLRKGFSEDVRNMYADILKYEKFRHQFMGMWQLPEDYQL